MNEGRNYEVTLEIAGPFALFARPDTGSTPVSYPVPTYSAAKGMFEAVARLAAGQTPLAVIAPTKVEVCSEITYDRYATNYGGPLRKSGQTTYQLRAAVLVDVCYRIHGIVEGTNRGQNPQRERHQLLDIFTRRQANGQTFYTPCLGWKEFTPSYFGPSRETERNEALSLTIPSFLHSVFNRDGRLAPAYQQDARIEQGVLHYERR